MNNAGDFGQLEDAMLYRVLPRVRRTDLKDNAVVVVVERPEPSLSSGLGSGVRAKVETTATKRKPKKEPALPAFALTDSVPSVRIAARPPSPKFRVVCSHEAHEDVSEHVIDYTSEAALPAHVLSANNASVTSTSNSKTTDERPSQAPMYTCLREGVSPPRGLAASTIVFLAVIALAVIAMSIVALAVLVPGADWALIIQG